ncbi:hypothetical protein GCK32_005462 [Trichostrongylus colubriformis]|uniref:Uncharacterized protein n=1 Tax=Trichostrongylus colubriformis TaxID=6319 RepID=A0AAN8FDV3_TRICO
MKEFFNEAQNLPPNTLQSLQQQFPEQASALQNWISRQDVQNFLNCLPNDGSEQDPDNVNEYIKKLNQVWPIGLFVPQMLS